jgi:multidrug efflux pump subunit AcrA (membrane-fusion protein)
MNLNRTLSIIALAAAPLAAALAEPATTPVEFRDVDEVYAADGVIEAVRQATVAAQVAGRIVELRADVGDRVAKGQVLARIDEREAAQVVASSEAQIARVRTGAKGASAELSALGRTVPAKSVTVLPSADARTHTKLVRLDLPDGDATKGAYPGMFARGRCSRPAARASS